MAATRVVAPAVSPEWLTYDKSPVESGYGPVPVPAGGEAPNPSVPVQDNPIPSVQPDYAPYGDVILTEPEFGFPYAGDNTGEPIQTPQGYGGEDNPDTSPAANATFPGMVTQENVYPGMDAHSQMTDNLGWDQYTPSGRDAVRQIFTSDFPGYAPAWYEPSLNTPEKLFPVGAVPIMNDETGQYAPLPDMVALGSQGNGVYQTPGPPATQPVPPAEQVDFQGAWV